jgi:hypothetical protein
VIALAPGDAFEVNGRFACVVHPGKTKTLVRIMNDEVTYTVTRALAETLVQAFKTDPRVEVLK